MILLKNYLLKINVIYLVIKMVKHMVVYLYKNTINKMMFMSYIKAKLKKRRNITQLCKNTAEKQD